MVIYIPPPPEEEENATSTAKSYEYPPKPLQSSKTPQRRFKFLRTIPTFGPNDRKKSKKPDEKVETENASVPSSSTWEETWEQGEYPFVRIEGNRAHCVICISDFEEPNRKGAATKEKEVSKTPGVQNKVPPNSSNPSAEPRQDVEERPQEELRLTEPGEGSQPLRLLPCRHAFHVSLHFYSVLITYDCCAANLFGSMAHQRVWPVSDLPGSSDLAQEEQV